MHPDECWGLRRGDTYVHGVSEIRNRVELSPMFRPALPELIDHNTSK